MTNDGVPQQDVYGQYAGFVTRMVAIVSDLAIILFILIAIGIASALIQTFFGFSELMLSLLNIVVLLLGLSVLTLYFILFWTLTGQTPGHYLMGSRVVRTDGGRVTIGVAVRRLIGYYISAFLFLGFLWVLWDNKRQGWHDKLAGTYVVYAWSFDKDLERGRPLQERAQNRRQLSASQGK